MKNEQLVVASANAPHDLEVVAVINGVILAPVLSAEVKEGRIVLACEAEIPKVSRADATEAQCQISTLASVLLSEFGGPTKDESACEMAVRLLREQRTQIEQLTAPPSTTGMPVLTVSESAATVAAAPATEADGIELK
jgi:hypothetical protein